MVDLYQRKNYSIAQIAYFAGIMDGEGCFYIGNHSHNKVTGAKYYQTVLKVASTDPKLIDWLKDIFGGLTSKYTRAQTPKSSLKPVFQWVATGERLTHLCELILPFVITKKQEVEILLKMRATYNGVTQKGKQGIQAHSQELLDLRQTYMDELRALHCRNHTYKK